MVSLVWCQFFYFCTWFDVRPFSFQPVYHSQFNETASEDVCGCALLPLGHSSARGPAQIVHVGDSKWSSLLFWNRHSQSYRTLFLSKDDPGDIVDEAISLFRANVLFRNFEIQGPADRVLIYLTLFIHQCLKRVEKKKSRAEAEKDLYSLASSPHVLPGDSTWPLTTLIDMPRNEREKGKFKVVRM